MLKKLRVKFIALNMATVAVVLAVVFTAICVIDYQQSVARVHETLDAALAHAGDAGGGPSSGTQPGAQVPADAARANGMPPEIGGKRGGSDPAIPVAVFSVEADGSLAAVQTRTTASIADDVLAQAAAALADQPDGSGSLDGLGLFYEKRTVGGAAYLAFADMSAASGWQTLAVTLAGVGAAALAAFFVISMFFSRWALAPVDRAWRQQRRFVADASHDLKTPLTVILANTSILLEHPERSIASQSQWIESTQHEAQQMQGLVGDLLLLAQVDEGAAPPPMERLDLTDLVEGELLQFESVAFERAVDLQSQLDESVMVRGNAMRLRKLVGTLLDNACKYADDGGSVNVSLRQSVRRIELAVHNTGFAIAPEDLPHVFDRFYRADKARTRDDSGYGLGLAIAHAIAEEHGGNLAAASDDERGTTFTLTLPTLRLTTLAKSSILEAQPERICFARRSTHMALHSWLARPQRRLGPLGLIVLLAGILTYALASALCALSVDIVMLIATRILQALGAGAVSAVSTAVVKDAVVPERREALLSVVQVMFVVGPVLAPVAGALILQVADWRMTFWVLAGIGLLCAGLALLFDETLPVSERYEGTVLGSVKQLGAVARNKGFSAFLGIVGLYNLPFMAYIAVGSYVYITFFGLTELEYSMYFAFAALLTAAGPFIWLAASRFMSARRFTSILLGIALASGAAMLAVGQASPQLFCITFLAFALTEAAVRPYSTNVLLSQQEGDTGAASSLINFAHTAIGCVGMLAAVLPWPNYVVGVGVIIVGSMGVAIAGWVALLRSNVPLRGIKDAGDEPTAAPDSDLAPQER